MYTIRREIYTHYLKLPHTAELRGGCQRLDGCPRSEAQEGWSGLAPIWDCVIVVRAIRLRNVSDSGHLKTDAEQTEHV